MHVELTAHCWLYDENLILGTSDGEILILDTYCDYKMKLPDPHKNTPYEVTCIINVYKGFICGYANGRIQIYTETNDNDKTPYVFLKKLDLTTGDDIKDIMIRDMSISPSADQENLICLTNTNLIYKIKLEKDQDDIEEPKFELISSYAHEGKITAMDICIRKPLIVTCGTDRYLRIWNYVEKR